MANQKVTVDGLEISIKQVGNSDYISLTDMIRNQEEPDQVLRNWLRRIDTIEFLAAWETLYNPDFKPVEFDRLRSQAGTTRFTLSVSKWCQSTGAIGIMSKQGRGGGTYAHRDIAFNFGETISPMFHLLLIREFQRLKSDEAKRLDQEFSEVRFLSKINYTLQTKAIEENILPRLNRSDRPFAYSSEADLLNQVVFGLTAKQWREANPDLKGNIRDHASLLELNILNNLQARNSELIDNGVEAHLRYRVLLQIAQKQFQRLADDHRLQSPGEQGLMEE